MASLRFSRADAYVAGDVIIQLYIDGNKAGSLIGAKPLELELPAGPYAVQARMFGTLRGETLVVNLDSDAAVLNVSVCGTRIGLVNNVSMLVLWFAVMLTPDSSNLVFGIKIAVLALLCGYDIYRWRKLKPQLLGLRISEGAISESRASSTPLSSPR